MEGFDVCNFAYALAFGTILYFLLYGGRRAHNRYRRRNHKNHNNNSGGGGGGGIGTSDVSNDVPEHLGWGFDKRDRDFIRLALLGSGLSLLFCYLKNRKNCHYSEPMSQDGGVYSGEYWDGGRRQRLMSDESSPNADDMTYMSDVREQLRLERLRDARDLQDVLRRGTLGTVGRQQVRPVAVRGPEGIVILTDASTVPSEMVSRVASIEV
jgi:hypothetical protein